MKMTVSNSVRLSCHVVTAVILLLIGLVHCGCNQKPADEPQKPAEIPKKALPETYGIYALVNGDYEQLNSSSASPPTLPATAEFLIFDRSLALGLGDPERTVQLLGRKYVRKEVEHIKADRDQPATGLEVKDGGYFLPTTLKFALRFGPAENRQDMLKAIPVSAMSRGLYYLRIGNDNYAFSVGISEQDGKKLYAVDKHITTVKNRWSDRKEEVKSDYEETGALDIAIEDLKRKARDCLLKNQVTDGFQYAKSYLRFGADDDGFAKQIQAAALIHWQDATNRELWGCAIILAREAASLQMPEAAEMERLAERNLQDWNAEQAALAEKREQQANIASKTKWQQGSDGVMGINDGNNGIDISSNMRVTDVGIEASRRKAGAFKLWWGDIYYTDKVTESFQNRSYPSIKFNPYTLMQLATDRQRDEVYTACVEALADFRRTRALLRLSCDVTDKKTVVWTIQPRIRNTMSTPVSLPVGWKVVEITGPTGFLVQDEKTGNIARYQRPGLDYTYDAREIYPWKASDFKDDSGKVKMFAPPNNPVRILCDYGGMGVTITDFPLRIEMALP